MKISIFAGLINAFMLFYCFVLGKSGKTYRELELEDYVHIYIYILFIKTASEKNQKFL